MFLKEFKQLLQQGVPLWYAPYITYNPSGIVPYSSPIQIVNITKKYIDLGYNNDGEEVKITSQGANARIYVSYSDAELQIIKQYESIQTEYNRLQTYINEFDKLKQEKPYLFI